MSSLGIKKGYFVYGALMAHPLVRKVGIRALGKDHEVDFKLRGERWIEPSFCTLHPKEGKEAWGVYLELPEKEFKKISRHEVGYDVLSLDVLTDQGEIKKAQAFSAAEKKLLPQALTPSSRYGIMLYESSLYFEFPQTVIDRYHQVVREGNSFTRKVFWYVPLLKWFIPRVPRKSVRIAMACTIVLSLMVILGLVWLAYWTIHQLGL